MNFLSMPPASFTQAARPRGYIWQFDILRGLAVLAVIYFHAGKHLPRHPWLVTSGWYGWCGVDLFFVLSGFLITGILLDARGTDGFFTNFYARRILRIWPLYFAMLGMLLVVLPHIVPAMMAESVASARPVWAYPLHAAFESGAPGSSEILFDISIVRKNATPGAAPAGKVVDWSGKVDRYALDYAIDGKDLHPEMLGGGKAHLE